MNSVKFGMFGLIFSALGFEAQQLAADVFDRRAVQFDRVAKVGLAACLGQDPKLKIAKVCDPVTGRLRGSIESRCVTPAVPLNVAMPGCFTADPLGLATCLEDRIRCRACLAVNDAFNANADCDVFDDAVDNGSCQ